MKVFAVLFLAISAAAALRSGPYLPSGWRPKGPAFNLPDEEVKPELKTAQEPLVDETEASGSEALREYGPPELKMNLSVNQELPDVATEQNFLRAVNNEDVTGAIEGSANIEANTEQITAEGEERSAASNSQSAISAEDETTATLADIQTTAESSTADDQKEGTTDVVQSKESENTDAPLAIALENGVETEKSTQESDIEASVTSENPEAVPEAIPTILSELKESVTAINEESTENAVPSATENAENAVPSAPENAENAGRASEGVDIEAVVSLDDEVKAREVQAVENDSSKAVSGSLEQTAEGFLEYGPPGFTEYGPPKEAAQRLSDEVPSNNGLENNEVRRRRFSPKLRSQNRHH